MIPSPDARKAVGAGRDALMFSPARPSLWSGMSKRVSAIRPCIRPISPLRDSRDGHAGLFTNTRKDRPAMVAAAFPNPWPDGHPARSHNQMPAIP